jgi:Rhodopirellula transposase DDE domain
VGGLLARMEAPAHKVERRLFSFISINWRGRLPRTYETIISLISNTTNRGGLLVRARLDRRSHPIGKKVSAKDLRELKIDRDNFHGDWN